VNVYSEPDFNQVRPCFVKMWRPGPPHQFADVSLQKLTMNSALQLYAVLLLLSEKVIGDAFFFNSEASLYRSENLVLHQVNF